MKFSDRVSELPLKLKGFPEIEMRHIKTRIHFQRLAPLRFRFVETTGIKVDQAEIGINDQGNGIEFDSAFCFRNPSIKLADRHERKCKPMVRRRVIRI